MQNGYVNLWRKSIKSRVFKNTELWKVWTWCLMKANHQQKWVSFKTGRSEIEIEVLSGQFIFGRKSAQKDLDMPESSIWKRMLKLKNLQNLNIESNSQYSLITILNWDTYQTQKIKGDGKGDRQVTGKEQARNTNNNDKNVKKENKKNIYGEFKNVRLTDEEFEKLKIKFGESGTNQRIESLSEYMESKGKKYASHYATILTWERKNEKNPDKKWQQGDPFNRHPAV